jgi:hypothetical protein
MMRLTAISSYIAPMLKQHSLRARVDSAFAEAVNLRAESGSYFALVGDRIGNGPLNAVVDTQALLAVMRPGDEVSGDGRWLRLAPGWQLDLSCAVIWDTCPDYGRLAQRPQVVQANLQRLRTGLPLEAPPASLAAAPAFHTQGAFGSRPAMALIQSQAAELTDGLRRSFNTGNLQWIKVFARRLAGLGPGLTPAGDDWLAGWLIGLRAWAELSGQERDPLLSVDVVGEAVIEAAEGYTTGLSLAFLRAAAVGAVAQGWHALLDGLCSADPMALREATYEVLQHGGTSGADMLAGFLAAFEERSPHDPNPPQFT